MRYLTILLAVALTGSACQTTPQSATDALDDSALGDLPFQQSQAVALSVTLTEATQRPTPTGLTTQLSIRAEQAPEPGGRVEVTWEAVDGDPDREPRRGGGQFELSSDGTGVSLSLTAADQPEEATLRLTGSIVEGEIRGTFSDRLFYQRAGLFRAVIDEP